MKKLLVLLLACTNAWSTPLPDILLKEATSVTKGTCIWDHSMYDCHMVTWKDEEYVVVSESKKPVFVLKKINGKVTEVWRYDYVDA